jgi:hypothetical protein
MDGCNNDRNRSTEFAVGIALQPRAGVSGRDPPGPDAGAAARSRVPSLRLWHRACLVDSGAGPMAQPENGLRLPVDQGPGLGGTNDGHESRHSCS